jgi:hypothetical protein
MKLRLVLPLVAVILAFGAITNAQAQQIPRQGTLESASTNVRANSTATVFTTPSTGHFILTMACTSSPSLLLSGSTFGFIAAINQTLPAVGYCTSFALGYAIPQSEAIQCQNTARSHSISCSVSGVLEVTTPP